MTLRQQRWLGGAVLVLAAILVWARDTRWLAFPADSLPLALGLPLAWMLGRPWLPVEKPSPMSSALKRWFGLGLVLFGLGWLLPNITLLACGWSLLAFVWAEQSFRAQASRSRLIWLLLLSFPWLILEWQSIGWAFRLSSAAVCEVIFNLLQMPVTRDGVYLNVMGIPIEIEAACAGWNLLQLSLLTGVAFGSHEIRSTRRFAMLLGALPAIAWFANFLRILLISAVALSLDAEVATGPIHGLTGLAVLGAVLGMTKILCGVIDSRPTTVRRRARPA
jgi:exosortase/archaeosortase family protein